MTGVVDRWNAVYFDGRLSAQALTELRPLESACADALALADRAFRLMRMAGLHATDLSAVTAWMVGFSMPRTVPSAWSGLVPPVTLAGRHRLLDDYVADNPWHQPGHEGGVFLDLGCGFPPLTTMGTARHLSRWRVIGADPAFGHYLVHDDDGAYASFDQSRRLRYFQGGTVDPDPDATAARFRALLDRLLPRLPDNPGTWSEVADEHGSLTREPWRRYQDANLELLPAGIGEVTLDGGADVIRCMNVFMYHDHAFRERTLAWAATLLRPGGLFICGSNWAHSASSRYTVYRHEDDRLVAREFAFSVENLRPIELAPWYALHDDNLDNLANAHAVRTIRTDRDFRIRFDHRLDELLAELGVCHRNPSGYLDWPPRPLPPDDLARSSAALAARLDAEGFTEKAADVLRRAGHHAWRNHAGHVAVRPFTPPALPPSPVL